MPASLEAVPDLARVGVVRATDEQTALAELIARHRIAAHAEAPHRVACRVRVVIDAEKTTASLHPRGLRVEDRRFPKRDPEIEAMYPGHLLPSSPQMLEELLRRSLKLEQSVIREPLIVVRAA